MAFSPEEIPGDGTVASLRQRWHRIIFGTDSVAGRRFDVLLLWLILCSVLTVVLESVASIRNDPVWHAALDIAEWAFTIVFTVEYLTRLWVVRRPLAYAWSFFGIIDLVSIVPTYLTLVVSDTEYLVVIRVLRLLRIFRILKMVRHLGEARIILSALRASRPTITVFLFGIFAIATIMGSVMYMVEGGREGTDVTSIPKGIYWAIVTMTTVGYGDVTPDSVVGQIIAAGLMVLGYAIIAVPTGIVGVDLVREMERLRKTDLNMACPECGADRHRHDARYCFSCGHRVREGEGEWEG